MRAAAPRRFLQLMRVGIVDGVPWWFRRRTPTGPQLFRGLLEKLGGSFVKLGQMLSLQPDLVPAPYCRALQDLLDRVPAFPFEEAAALIEVELGRPPSQLFDRIDQRPLATASVAQVHVAWIGGQKVAVKVQRPTAERDFGNDIRLVGRICWLIRRLRLRPLYWLLEPLGEFVAWTAEELDFRCEARYAEQLGDLAEGHAIQRVPRVHRRLTTRRVLVVDFLDGAVLLDYLRALEADPTGHAARALEPPGFDPDRFAANIVDNFLVDAFEHGIYHADLHPANLLMLDSSVVGYVDFGITGLLSRPARRQLMAMTLALVTGDMDLFHRCFRSLTAPDPRARPEVFRRGLDDLARHWYDPDSGALRVNFTRIMVDMLALSRRADFLPERDIVKYIRSSISIDGLIVRFAPQFDVGSYLAERCADLVRAERRRELLALPRLVEWVESSGRLLVDGPERFRRFVERNDAGSLEADRAALPPPSS
ncbi:MAG: AarF/UbiB family protein, partial [Acidobacteriota bacterium]